MLKKFLSFSTIKVVGLALSVLYVFYLGKLLQPEDLGVYYLSITLLTFLMAVSRLGFDNYVLKQVSIYYRDGDFEAIVNLLSNVRFKILIMSLVLSLLALSFQDVIEFYFFDGKELKEKYYYIIGSLFFYNMSYIYSESCKASGFLNFSIVLPSLLFPLINVTVLFLGVLLGFNVYDVVFISILISTVLMFVVSSIYYYMRVISSVKSLFFTYRKYNIDRRQLVSFYFIAISNFIFATIDTIVLGALSSNSDVGIYNVILRFALPFSITLIAISSIYSSKFAIMNSNSDRLGVKRLYKKLTRVSFYIGIIYFVIIIFFGNELLLFFGEQYSAGFIPLIIIAFGNFILLATGPSAIVLMMCGYEGMYKNLLLVSGCFNIAVSILFVSYYGLLGAAISTMLSLVFKNIVSYFLVYKCVKDE
ncbi:oligosaccharide flippase family protein [Shewanella sp. 1CM18E]|uniref:oligosaccharide flippase family protein n=1 Tax=Shewanella sp. 1CM18E TaxID=2929169 RepID=UPI0020BD5F13|nr:oligosaccharide flippase family protein [Shewanella sp. 1CM18E]